jgi:hypothetical protein
MSDHNSLPHWDLSVIYKDIDSPEFEAGFAAAIQEIDDLVKLFDEHGINRLAEGNGDVTPTTFETIINRYNHVVERVYTLNAYIRAIWPLTLATMRCRPVTASYSAPWPG